jgi:enterochelin esterase-like enzyme
MVVGVHGFDDDERRFTEYVPGVDERRFGEHEQFFLEDVPRWVSDRFQLALEPEQTAVWGASLGGEFALAMGVRHPDVFGAVFCASPGGGFRPQAPLHSRLPRLYLVAGEQEPFFAENAKRWLDAVQDAGGDVVMEVREGDHGGSFWYEEFPLMVSWAFARTGER